jgi:hypothetical protein
VEQGSSNGGYQHPNHKLQAQIDALRNLASAPLSKTLTRTNSGYRTPSTDTSSICHGKPPRTTSVCKTQNQDEIIAGVGLGPNRSASVSILMSSPAQISTSSYPNTAASILVGGYRSSSVQLEVELVERLNEIGRSNVRTSFGGRQLNLVSDFSIIIRFSCQRKHYHAHAHAKMYSIALFNRMRYASRLPLSLC